MSLSNNERSFAFSVFVRCGRNFENKKWIEGNAPYVEVTIGDETKKTNKLSNLNNPSWNETLRFVLKDWNNLPNFIKFVVKDDRTLLPSALLGDYTFDLEKNKLLDYKMEQMSPFCTLYDGVLNLKNTDQGELDVKILFECSNCNWLNQDKQEFVSNEFTSNVNNVEQQQQIQYEEVKKTEYEKIPDIVLQKNEYVEDDKKDENKYKLLDQNEVHVLPTIHLKDRPNIIEKEVEYIKPVQVKETIVHKEKPIIIEQPIIKEKHEHYREATDYIRKNEKNVTETIHEQDVGNLDHEQLRNLREQRIQEFNDTTPIVQQQKEQIQMETEFREKPTEIREKQVIYQQPVEIEKTNIEKIIPKVREEVSLEKEHIHQKLAPEVYTEDAQLVREKDQFYSKETENNLKIVTKDDVNVNVNANNQAL